MAKVLDDGLMLTLGVVGVVAAAGAVVGRRGSRATLRNTERMDNEVFRSNVTHEVAKALKAAGIRASAEGWNVEIDEPWRKDHYLFVQIGGYDENDDYNEAYIQEVRGDDDEGWMWDDAVDLSEKLPLDPEVIVAKVRELLAKNKAKRKASRRGSRSMGINMLWTRPREGHLEAEVLVPKGSTRVTSDRFSAKVRRVGQNVEWEVLDGGRVVAHGVKGTVSEATKAAGSSVEMLISGQHGSRSEYREGFDRPTGTAYVVINRQSHGSKRLHGPFSSMREAQAWATNHPKNVEIKMVNLVSKGMDGDFMVIEDHAKSDSTPFEVFHGFFKTASVASRWINRQPDQQTLTDSFVVRVHRP